MWMVDGKRSHLNYFLNANNLWTKFHQTAEYVYNEFVVSPYCGGGGGPPAGRPVPRSLRSTGVRAYSGTTKFRLSTPLLTNHRTADYFAADNHAVWLLSFYLATTPKLYNNSFYRTCCVQFTPSRES